MISRIVLSTIVVGALAKVAVVYGAFVLVKPDFQSRSEKYLALKGDIPSQKHVASCYSHGGCPGYAPAPVIGCAWRQVIVNETGRAADAVREAEEACRSVSPSLSRAVAEARYDIGSRIAEIRSNLRAAH